MTKTILIFISLVFFISIMEQDPVLIVLLIILVLVTVLLSLLCCDWVRLRAPAPAPATSPAPAAPESESDPSSCVFTSPADVDTDPDTLAAPPPSLTSPDITDATEDESNTSPWYPSDVEFDLDGLPPALELYETVALGTEDETVFVTAV